MRRVILILCVASVVSIFTGCNSKDSKPKDSRKSGNVQTVKKNGDVNSEVSKDENTTLLYLVSKEKINLDIPEDFVATPSSCLDGLIPVKIDKKLSPEESLASLFEYKDNDSVINPLQYLQGLKIKEIILKNDFAIIKLDKDITIKKQACDILTAGEQIRKTLMQFDDIAGVDIFIGDEEFSGYFSKLSVE